MYSIYSQLYHDKPDKTDYEMLQCIYRYISSVFSCKVNF